MQFVFIHVMLPGNTSEERGTSPRSFLGRGIAGRALKKFGLGGLGGGQTERTQIKGEHMSPSDGQMLGALMFFI